ncbi:MAG: hypothetical protein EOO41_05485, partial [Methanobacteriota archaeon]
TVAPRVPPAAAGAGAGASPAAPPAAAPPAAAPAPAVSFGIPVPEHPTLAYVTDLRHLVSVTLIRKLTEQYAVEHAAAQKKGDEEEVMRCLSQIVTMEKLKSVRVRTHPRFRGRSHSMRADRLSLRAASRDVCAAGH